MKLLLTLLCAVLVWAGSIRDDLGSLERDAIVIGYGLTPVYVFVDPLCPNSRNFIEVIQSSQKVQKDNTYFVFLYRLQMFDSDGVINAIYHARNPKEAMLDVMVKHHAMPREEAVEEVVRKRKRIKEVAMKIDMHRRPYLMMYPIGGRYCKVSEGKAACMLQSSK